MNQTMQTIAQDAYDADAYRGAIGAAKESRAKAKAESEAAKAAIEELIKAATDVANEHFGIVAGTKYNHEDDEVGERVCCGVVSYTDHADDCAAVRLRAALARVGGEA